MKSEIIKKEKELKFPCLMVSEDTGNVYLMSSEKVGTCIHSNDKSAWSVSDFCDMLDHTILTPFKGKIILQND